MSYLYSRCKESIRRIKLGVKNTQGQATLEYALVLFSCLIVITSLGVIYHFVQNGAVMDGACAEGLRVATTSSDTELIESYIKRRLKAIPEIPLFHKSGDEDWNISIDKKEKDVLIEITGHVAAMPPIGWCLFLAGQTDDQGIVLKSSLSASTYPDWIEGSYADWIAFWKGQI